MHDGNNLYSFLIARDRFDERIEKTRKIKMNERWIIILTTSRF